MARYSSTSPRRCTTWRNLQPRADGPRPRTQTDRQHSSARPAGSSQIGSGERPTQHRQRPPGRSARRARVPSAWVIVREGPPPAGTVARPVARWPVPPLCQRFARRAGGRQRSQAAGHDETDQHAGLVLVGHAGIAGPARPPTEWLFAPIAPMPSMVGRLPRDRADDRPAGRGTGGTGSGPIATAIRGAHM